MPPASKESIAELQQRLQEHLARQLEAVGGVLSAPEAGAGAKEAKRPPPAVTLKGARVAAAAGAKATPAQPPLPRNGAPTQHASTSWLPCILQ